MFHQFSWQGYWTFIALTASTYYILICFIYYRKDLHAWWRRKKAPTAELSAASLFASPSVAASEPSPAPPDTALSLDFGTPTKDSEEYIVYASMDELEAFFKEARSRKWNRQELITSLQQLLSKYPALKTSAYKESMSHVLATQCEHHCSLHLSAEDLDVVWR